MIGGLIAGGLSALAGMWSGRKRNKATTSMNDQNIAWAREQAATVDRQRTEDYTRQKEFAQNAAGWQFKDLMKAADESGIHRLSALGAGGGGGYSGAVAATPAPTLSEASNAYVGDAVGQGLQAYMAVKEMRNREKQNQLDNDHKQAQIDLMRSESRTNIALARRASQGGPPKADFGNNTLSKDQPEDLMVSVKMPDGSVREIPVGPDLDEILAGGGLLMYDKAADVGDAFASKEYGKGKRRGDRGRKSHGGLVVSPSAAGRPTSSKSRKASR